MQELLMYVMLVVIFVLWGVIMFYPEVPTSLPDKSPYTYIELVMAKMVYSKDLKTIYVIRQLYIMEVLQ